MMEDNVIFDNKIKNKNVITGKNIRNVWYVIYRLKAALKF
jgi:hypothetical protein